MAFPLLLFLVFATSDRDRDEHPARGEPQLHRRRRAAVDADVWLDALDGVGDNLLEPQRRADDLVVVLLAVPLGAFTGTRVGALSDRAIMTITLIGICTHPMVLGNVLVQIFGCQGLRWDLDYGYCPLLRGPGGMCGGVRDWSSHLILPWATFALLYLALYTRMIRASVSDTLHEEFVRAARAKGASELRVVVRHVLPAVSLRVLTMVGMEIGTAIGICIYIEKVFGLHGIASYAVDAMGRAATDIDLPFTLARDADHADRHDREPRRGRPLRGRRPRAAWGRRRRQSKSVVGGVS